MITASHNPAQDNGVKIIDSNGNMMEQALEPVSENLINAQEHEMPVKFKQVLDVIGLSMKDAAEQKGTVLIGQDTRASSKPLAKAVMY